MIRALALLGLLVATIALTAHFDRKGNHLDPGVPVPRASKMPTFNPESIRAALPSVGQIPTDWSQFQPEDITIALPKGPMTFHVVRCSSEGGITTWIGRNAAPFTTLVAIGKPALWFAELAMPGATYHITVDAFGAHVVDRSEPLDCGGILPPHSRQGAQNPLAMANDGAGSAGHPLDVLVGDPTVHPSGGTIYNLDIVFFYSPEVEAATRAGVPGLFDPQTDPQSYLDSLDRATVETCNLVLEQSGVPNFHWRYIGLFETPAYTPQLDTTYSAPDIDSMEFDLNTAMDTKNPVGAFIEQKSAEVHADQEIFTVGRNRNHGGLAAGYDNTHLCVMGFTLNYHAVAHETGHNCGLHHDRVADQAPDGNGQYYYGYSFPYNPADHGAPAFNSFLYYIGDVMATPSGNQTESPKPWFSSPKVAIDSDDMGFGDIRGFHDMTKHPLGVAADRPKAADAVRWLTEHAATKAAVRNPPGEAMPSIAIQPVTNATAVIGESLHLSVSGSPANVTYQWRKDGTPISGATSSTFTIPAFQSLNAGHYDVAVWGTLGAVVSSGTTVTATAGAITSKLINISTRSLVGNGTGSQIAGFVVGGDQPKTLLIRASGPGLTNVSVPGGISDPTLELHDSKTVIASNDDWSQDSTAAAAIRNAANGVNAFPLTAGSKDAAILITLNPGLYSAVVNNNGTDAGIALVEVYEVSGEASHLINISTRSPVANGDGVQIAGFVIDGNGPRTVLIRASGPALASVGFQGGVPDPTLELHDIKNVIGYNDDWSSDPGAAIAIRAAAAKTNAFTWANGSKDAALLMTLSPGIYTAVVTGKGAAGIALIEVYAVP